jgi:tRNA threonylcarbamoyladenosine biosynthesis protein TsaE
MATLISHSAAETEALGERFGRAAESGWVLGLSGDLGAGKTQWVRGLAGGLGIGSGVHSPTFSLINVYEGGRLKLFHIDLYRLETVDQILAAGLEEYLRPAGITVIEWAERWFAPDTAGRSPPAHTPTTLPQLRWIQIETLGPSDRRITYDHPGD